MNKHRSHMLWLVLPAVLVVAGIVVFQPGRDESLNATSVNQFNDTTTVPGRIEHSEARLVDLTNDDSPQELEPPIAQEVARDREFINYAFPLLSTWKLQELKPLLAEETIAASSDEELNEVMSVLEDRLGELKSFETPQPVLLQDALPEQDSTQEGELQHYQFVAYYEAGEAEIDLILHKRQDDSSLYSFNIHVPTQEENVF